MRDKITARGLLPEEANALYELSQVEHRDPRDQAAMLIREGLVRRGFLKMAETPQPTGQIGGGLMTSKPRAAMLGEVAG